MPLQLHSNDLNNFIHVINNVSFSLLAMGNFFSWQHISTSLIIWTLNVMVLFGCLVKLLVYGDPVLQSESKANQEYWKHKKKADTEFSKVSVSVFSQKLH